MVGMRNRFYLHLLHHGMLQHYHCFDLMKVRIERKRPFFTSGQRSENNPWSCFPVTSHRGCDQYVCYPRPGQLINRSQLLCWKTSYHHIRSGAVYLLWSISTKDLHLSAFGCPEDQFRERHWRISKHQLPYSKTINPCTYPQNMDLKEKKYPSNLVSVALNLRRTVWETPLLCMATMASYHSWLLPHRSYCRP